MFDDLARRREEWHRNEALLAPGANARLAELLEQLGVRSKKEQPA